MSLSQSTAQGSAEGDSLLGLLLRYFLPVGLLVDARACDIWARRSVQEANRRVLVRVVPTFCRRLSVLAALLFAAGSELPIEIGLLACFLGSTVLIPLGLLVSAWIALQICRVR